jgi:hypothetical protein
MIMANTSKRFEKLSEFFNKKGNENIKAEQIIRKDAPNGWRIDIDSFTEEQIKEFSELDRKYQN